MKFLKILLIFLSFQIQAQTEKIYTIPLDNGHLEGSLIVADSTHKTLVVLIIPGSGPTDRNGNNPMAKNNGLKMLADSLAKHHISSLRIDKRMIGKSRLKNYTEKDIRFDDFVNDAVMWIQKLKNSKQFSKIIVAGHSQGALVGLLASKKAPVDAYISLAGAGYKISDILKEQFSKALPHIKKQVYQVVDTLASGKKVPKVSGMLQMLFRPSVQDFLISWMRYDPAEELADLDIPTLIIQGNTDLQVPVNNAKRLQKFQPKARLVIIKGMNHILKPAPKDRLQNMAIYNQPNLPLHPELMAHIVSFVKNN